MATKKTKLDPNDPDYLVNARLEYLEQEKAGAQAAMSEAADDTENPFPSPLMPDMEHGEAPEGIAGGKQPKGSDDANTRTFPDAPDRGEDMHGAAKKGKR